jgi:hypothetical protein
MYLSLVFVFKAEKMFKDDLEEVFGKDLDKFVIRIDQEPMTKVIYE